VLSCAQVLPHQNLPASHQKMKTSLLLTSFYVLPLKMSQNCNTSLIHWHQLDLVGWANVLQSVASLMKGDKLMIGAIITSSVAKEFFSTVRWPPCSWSGRVLKWWEILQFPDFKMKFGCKSMTTDGWSDSLMLGHVMPMQIMCDVWPFMWSTLGTESHSIRDSPNVSSNSARYFLNSFYPFFASLEAWESIFSSCKGRGSNNNCRSLGLKYKGRLYWQGKYYHQHDCSRGSGLMKREMRQRREIVSYSNRQKELRWQSQRRRKTRESCVRKGMFDTLLSGITTSVLAREIFCFCQVAALESIMRRKMRCKNRWRRRTIIMMN
jgi:hypothetical protein